MSSPQSFLQRESKCKSFVSAVSSTFEGNLKTDIHNKDLTLRVTLKWRLKQIRKWPIAFLKNVFLCKSGIRLLLGSFANNYCISLTKLVKMNSNLVLLHRVNRYNASVCPLSFWIKRKIMPDSKESNSLIHIYYFA